MNKKQSGSFYNGCVRPNHLLFNIENTSIASNTEKQESLSELFGVLMLVLVRVSAASP